MRKLTVAGPVADSALFDGEIDPVGGAKKPPWARPIMVISIVETLLIDATAFFIWGCYEGSFHTSPRKEEWFGWAPEGARFWLLNLSAALSIGWLLIVMPLTIYFLMIAFILPPRFRDRFPLRLGLGGSPPLLGAVLFLAVGVLFMAPFIIIGAYED
jgi:hypothetical protein